LKNQKNQNKENEKEEASRRQEVCQNGRYVFVTFFVTFALEKDAVGRRDFADAGG
jgi:hypothetical protein